MDPELSETFYKAIEAGVRSVKTTVTEERGCSRWDSHESMGAGSGLAAAGTYGVTCKVGLDGTLVGAGVAAALPAAAPAPVAFTLVLRLRMRMSTLRVDSVGGRASVAVDE